MNETNSDTDSNPHDDTIPMVPRSVLDASRLQKGMQAAFSLDPDASVNSGDDVFRSIVQLLGEDTGAVSRISLPEIDDEPSPLHRGRTEALDLPPQIGRYRVAGEIARGGVGSIYKARDEDLGRDVALKVLLGDYRANVEMTQRFMEEAQIGGQLQHPGIVPVHEVGLFSDKQPYFAMKLVKGQTLARLLENRGNPTEDRLRFLNIFEQVCQPLGYAHARAVIHRDLKPSNVMVGAFGEVQVMDWGLAKVLRRGGITDDRRDRKDRPNVSIVETVRSGNTGSESMAGTVLGTPAYMAPEQARGEIDDLDERSDVFGLGAILCEILTGEPPYVGESAKETYRQAKGGYLDGAMERLASCGADPRVIDLARRCLAFKPRERPRDAKAVSHEISAYLESLEEQARTSEIRAAQAQTRADEERKARRLTLGLALAVLVVGFVGGAGYLWVDGERRDAVARADSEKRQAVERASAQVEQALARALLLRGEAASASDLPREIASWSAVREAVDQARNLAPSDVASELRSELDNVHSEVEEALRLRELLSRLREAQSAESDEEMDRKYWDAFHTFISMEISELTPAEMAERLRSKRFDAEIALALDEWALVRMGRERPWRHLKDSAIQLDPNPLRAATWKSIEDRELEELEALLATEPTDSTPAVLLGLVAEWLASVGDAEKAERLARRAVRLEPESFRANLALGRFLAQPEVGRFSESIPYLAVARALRPRSPGVLKILFDAMIGTGAFDEALSVLEEVAARDLTWVRNHRAIFRRGDLRFSSDALERFIDDLLQRNDGASKAKVAEVLVEPLLRLCEQGHGEKAESIALEFSRSTHDVASALYCLARVRFARGRRVEAVRTLEEAFAAPHRPWSWGFSVFPQKDLAVFRRSVAPELVSPASVDDALSTLDAPGRSAELAGHAESIRKRLRQEDAPALAAYLDGRLLELGGDWKGAGERYRAAIELDRSFVEPFSRLYESLRMNRGSEVAYSVVRGELAKGAPAGLLQLPPHVPRDLETRMEDEGVRLRASDFLHIDRRVRHVASRWRVRRDGGDYDRSPVADTVNRGPHLSELKLPWEALEPRTKYFWTVSYLGSAGKYATSEEGTFTTEDYVFETERFRLDRYFNRDIVANPGDGSNDTVDGGNTLVVAGFEDKRGLPANRRVGVHRLGSYNDLNCVQLGPNDTKAIRIEVPQRRYSEVRFLVTGGFGDTRIPVTFLYADGHSETRTLHCDDWLDDATFYESPWGAITAGVQPIANGMDAHPGFEHRGDAALFEARLETDTGRTLAAFVLQPAGAQMVAQKTRFNLLAVTGVWIGHSEDASRR